jgi:Ser/Thr protein kinase RdoA (MazF antagonist)
MPEDNQMKNPNPHAFELLTPDSIMDAVESCGFLTDGRLLALNSYENRWALINLSP